jgi:MoaA/NifB/PqqE/SkfB family radical SAM enzyme
MLSFNPDTYCSLPFVGFDNRVKHICCWTSSIDIKNKFNGFSQCVNSDIVKNLQQDLLLGVKNSLCQTCWAHESIGVSSMRQKHNQNKSVEVIENEIAHKQLKHLVIDSGNVCNLSCRTCSPFSSSSLIKEFQAKSKKFQVGTFATTIKSTNIEQLKTENFNCIETLSILGGEPFQNLDHIEILEHIIDLERAGQCVLYYSTNGTVPISNRLKNIFTKFKAVNLSLSIDAIETQFEYIRTNGRWTDTYLNICELIDLSTAHPNICLLTHPTISALNILYLEPLFEWYSAHKFLWTIVFCNFPKEYSFNIFNDQQKEVIIKTLKKSKFDMSSTISQVQQSKFDPELLQRFYQQIEFTKEYKGLDASIYLPELLILLK